MTDAAPFPPGLQTWRKLEAEATPYKLLCGNYLTASAANVIEMAIVVDEPIMVNEIRRRVARRREAGSRTP